MSTNRREGMAYAPTGPYRPVVGEGEFPFAVAHLEHGHVYGQVNGLLEAGAHLRWVYDPDPAKIEVFLHRYPGTPVARDLEEIRADDSVRLIAAAAVPSERCDLGIRVMAAGKDYFTDKAPLTTLAQLEAARAATARTGRKYLAYYSERVHTESGVRAGELIADGAIGRVVQVLGLGPHRLSLASRPGWFFDKARTGGILVDLGCHQIEQFLSYTGAADAEVIAARAENLAHPDAPGIEDFGEALLKADNGASNYFRVDWFTADGLPTWGDGRTVVLGTDGTIEMRKYIDLARHDDGDHLYLVDHQGVHHMPLAGTVGYPFFGELILDCLHRTEHAMTQAHVFKTAELSLLAQQAADASRPARG